MQKAEGSKQEKAKRAKSRGQRSEVRRQETEDSMQYEVGRRQNNTSIERKRKTENG